MGLTIIRLHETDFACRLWRCCSSTRRGGRVLLPLVAVIEGQAEVKLSVNKGCSVQGKKCPYFAVWAHCWTNNTQKRSRVSTRTRRKGS